MSWKTSAFWNTYIQIRKTHICAKEFIWNAFTLKNGDHICNIFSTILKELIGTYLNSRYMKPVTKVASSDPESLHLRAVSRNGVLRVRRGHSALASNICCLFRSSQYCSTRLLVASSSSAAFLLPSRSTQTTVSISTFFHCHFYRNKSILLRQVIMVSFDTGFSIYQNEFNLILEHLLKVLEY